MNGNRIYKQLMAFAIIAVVFIAQAAKFENDTDETSYLFAPGLTSYETQLARYLPEFTGITGEKVSCSNGIHSIGKNVSTCKFSEIQLKNTKSCFKNPLYFITSLFIGLRDRKFSTQVTKNIDEIEYTLKSPAINFFNINLGQDNDIEMLKGSYERHLERYPNQKVVLYGASRGAAAAFNFMALYKPKEVKAAVFEGIFDDVGHLLKEVCGCFHKIAHFFVCKFTSFKSDGISPIQCIANFPKNFPLLIVSSKKDEMVPYSCAKNLYRQLKLAGYDHVHFLKLKNSNHDSYSCNNDEDKKTYEQVIHAFYKYYDLPYDQELAQAGAERWKQILSKSASNNNKNFKINF